MRVAVAVHNYPPAQGGVEFVAQQQAAHLAELGHHVDVFTSTSQAKPELRGDLAPSRARVNRRAPLFRVGNMPLLRPPSLSSYDVVHLHAPYLFGAEIWGMLTRLYAKPLVVSFHGDGQLTSKSSLNLSSLSQQYVRCLSTVSVRHARALCLLYPGQDAIPSLRSLRAQRFVVRNGVNADFFPASPPHRSRYKNSHKILWVGRLDQTASEYKRLDLALRAVMLNGKARLSVVGDGPAREKWERHTRALKLRERVVFCGRWSREQMRAGYDEHDALLVSSVSEGQPLTVLEAAARGLPVIAPRLPGISDALGRDFWGFTPGADRELSEAVRSWQTASEAARAEGAIAAQERVRENHSWDTTTSYLARALHSVTES